MKDNLDFLLSISEGAMKRITELQKHLNQSGIPEVKESFAVRISFLLDIVSIIQYTVSKEIKEHYDNQAKPAHQPTSQPAKTSNQPTSSSSSSSTS